MPRPVKHGLPVQEDARTCGSVWLTFCLLLAGGFWWLGTSTWAKPEVTPAPSATAPQTPAKYVTKPIREIEVGEWVQVSVSKIRALK